MEAINKLINEFYEKYKGLPSNNPIVRMNQKNDAFELVVFDTLYGEEKLDNRNQVKIQKNINDFSWFLLHAENP